MNWDSNHSRQTRPEHQAGSHFENNRSRFLSHFAHYHILPTSSFAVKEQQGAVQKGCKKIRFIICACNLASLQKKGYDVPTSSKKRNTTRGTMSFGSFPTEILDAFGNSNLGISQPLKKTLGSCLIII